MCACGFCSGARRWRRALEVKKLSLIGESLVMNGDGRPKDESHESEPPWEGYWARLGQPTRRFLFISRKKNPIDDETARTVAAQTSSSFTDAALQGSSTTSTTMARRAALLLHLCATLAAPDDSYDRGIAAARQADLAGARDAFAQAEPTANSLQALATLRLIGGDVAAAVATRRRARALDATALPPLAVLFRDGDACGGLGDVYWSAAFLLKSLDETNSSTKVAFEGHLQLSTVLEDSGALSEAARHVERAALLKPGDARLRFRSALLVPAVARSAEAVNATRLALEKRVAQLQDVKLDALDGVSMPGTFYLVYAGFADALLMTRIQRAYAQAHPPLAQHLITPQKHKVLKVGFAGAYWKRHSVCKLLCGVVRGLAALDGFEVTIFDATEEGGDDWLKWTLETGARRVELDMTLSSRIQAAHVDVLIYAELGMRARALTWAHARLAPVQVLFWGHPHTSGLPDSIDYFVSSDGFEPPNGDRFDAYAEQLVRFSTPGIYFRRPRGLYAPSSDAALDAHAVLFRRQLNMSATDPLYLCPQSLPKFHPAFDTVLLRLVANDAKAKVVITYDPKKELWLHVLKQRLGPHPRIVFLPLALGDAFFGLLRAATLLLDPFPFGGGVTTLEAFAACRLVVTAPALQSVVTLAAGFYRRLGLKDTPIVPNVDAYVAEAQSLAADAVYRGALEAAVCRGDDALFADDDAVAEWAAFLRRASLGAQSPSFSNTGSVTVSGISAAAAATDAAQAVLQDAIARVVGVDTGDVTLLSVAASARRRTGVDVAYRIASPDLAASGAVAERLAAAAFDPTLLDKAIADTAQAAS